MAGTQDQTQNGPWLIKTGDRVLGPFTTDEVGRLLRNKEIVVIDEAMAPQARWTYIRDVQVFQMIVEDIRRGLMDAREETEIQGYTEGAHAPPASTVVTATNFNNMSDKTVTEIEKPSLRAVSSASQPKPTRESPKENPKETPKELKPLTFDLPVVEQPYPMRPRERRTPGLMIGGIVLILAAAFVVYTVSKQPAKSVATSGASLETLESQASVAWKRGEFEKALELYRAINRHLPGDALVSSRVALLMMQLEGQTVEAKRLLEDVKAKTDDSEADASVQTALGLAALHNEDANEAVAHFKQAGSSWMTSFNLGVAHAALGNWTESIANLKRASSQPIGALMLAETQLRAFDATGKLSLQQDAESSLARALVQPTDYRQELFVVGAYTDVQSGNRKRAEERVLKAVETDPEQTRDHFHDPALSLDAVSWARLVPKCRAIDTALSSGASSALLGICLAKANQLEDAAKLIETKLSVDPLNPLLHSANALLHLTADRDDAARASLTLAEKGGGTRLSRILASRLCSKNREEACAEEGWSKLAAEQDPPLAAFTSLAQIKFQSGDQATGNALLVNAEKLSPTYLPLLRLRQDASR